MTTTTAVDIVPTGGCGAEIRGLDLKAARPEDLDLVRRTVFERGVVFLHDQHLSPEQQIAVAKGIGPIVVNRYFPPSERYPEIAKVEKTEAQTTNIGGGWHTDHSYDAEPAMGSVLQAIDLPPKGGDTLFADMYAAYEALADELKAQIEGRRAVHASAHIYGVEGVYAKTDQAHVAGKTDTPSAVHPVVITHPGSGRKALYVNPAFTIAFEGETPDQSRPLLQQLYAHAIQPQFTTRFQWREGSLAIWDNRATWHFAMNDYQGHHRLMHRITIAGGPLS